MPGGVNRHRILQIPFELVCLLIDLNNPGRVMIDEIVRCVSLLTGQSGGEFFGQDQAGHGFVHNPGEKSFSLIAVPEQCYCYEYVNYGQGNNRTQQACPEFCFTEKSQLLQPVTAGF